MSIVDTVRKTIKPVKYGSLKTYLWLSYGMLATHPEWINPDLLVLVKL